MVKVSPHLDLEAGVASTGIEVFGSSKQVQNRRDFVAVGDTKGDDMDAHAIVFARGDELPFPDQLKKVSEAVIANWRPKTRLPTEPPRDGKLLAIEAKLLPTPDQVPLEEYDEKLAVDNKPRTNNTGDAERAFVVPMLRWVLYGTFRQKKIALKALRSFSIHSLSQRPCSFYSGISSAPFKMHGDSFSKKWFRVAGQDTKYWNHDKVAPNGWNFGDVAHIVAIEEMWSGVCCGDQFSGLHLFFQSRTHLQSSNSDEGGYMGQTRSVGYVFLLAAYASAAGIGQEQRVADLYFGGVTPKQWLEVQSQKLLDLWHKKFSSSWHRNRGSFMDLADDRYASDVPEEWKDEVGHYKPFHWGLTFYAMGKALLLQRELGDVMHPETEERIREWLAKWVPWVCDGALGPNGSLSGLVGTTVFDDKAKALEFLAVVQNAKNRKLAHQGKQPETNDVYQLHFHAGQAGWIIRSQPKMGDSELLASGLALLEHVGAVRKEEFGITFWLDQWRDRFSATDRSQYTHVATALLRSREVTPV